MRNGQIINDRRAQAAEQGNRKQSVPARPVAIDVEPAAPDRGEQASAPVGAERPGTPDMMATFHRLRRSMNGTTEPERVIDQIIEAEGERSLCRAIKRTST